MAGALTRISVLTISALLASCGGETETIPGIGGRDQPPALAPQGLAIIKFRAAGSEWVALSERLRHIEDVTAPDRRLLVSAGGNQAVQTIEPPAGWSLIDFALHASGEITLILATDSELRLQRRAATGELLGESNFTDEQAAVDPFIGDIATIRDSRSLVPKSTRDAVRVAPVADDLVLALRTGRNAVVAQRLTYIGGGKFEPRWRTLVEPGVRIDWLRLTSGSFDPFASLDNQWQLVLDVDEQGRSAIAVSLGRTELPAGHRQYFGEAIDPALTNGAMLTLLEASGLRLSATPIDTQVISEVHSVRWAGDTVLVAGRMYTTRASDGTGWDGFLAQFKFGDPSARLQTLDFDRGDVILDVAPLRDGRIAVAGSTGYVQNPDGGSVSEDAEPLLAALAGAGAPAQRLTLPRGPRLNQVRTVAAWRERWLIGGLQNGPGTHSADADPARLTCDGFLHEQEL